MDMYVMNSADFLRIKSKRKLVVNPAKPTPTPRTNQIPQHW